MIDTHCHLDAAEFDADRGAVHAAAIAAGVTRIVVPGVAVDGFAKQKSTVAGLSGMSGGVWHSPAVCHAGRDSDDLRTLRDWLINEQPLAVGEIGLDFYVDRNDPVRQTQFFVAQLKLAREFDLPVILHVRRSIDAVLEGTAPASRARRNCPRLQRQPAAGR
jgi:TatD DNase family protein